MEVFVPPALEPHVRKPVRVAYYQLTGLDSCPSQQIAPGDLASDHGRLPPASTKKQNKALHRTIPSVGWDPASS